MITIYFLPTASSDYSPPPTNFEFQVGDARSCVDIIIRSDNLFEASEEFRGRATTTASGVIVDPSETTIEITDINGMINSTHFCS